jgi:pimeloyl-ACP methyl ester carboxylesterase
MARKSEVTTTSGGAGTVDDRFGESRRSLVLLVVAAVGIVLLVQTACNAAKRVYNAMPMWKKATLKVTVSNLPPAGTDAYVLIFRGDPTDPELLRCESLPESGNYSVKVPYETDLQVVAFADSNGNRRWEPDEPVDLLEKVNLESEDKEVKLSLRAGRSVPATLPLNVPAGVKVEQASSKSPGEVVDLDDPRFAAETGRTGLLKPDTFLKTYGQGIFFLQAYDPKKIPVLFIYGISGSPQDWRYIIEHFDQSRFQPWFFHYPTGDRLADRARELNGQVKRLHNRLQFKKLFVVAHSMGGLVARDFILRNTLDDHETYVTRFITISTPWGGHNAASLPIPSPPIVTILAVQNDIAPGSPFLTSLFERKLPPTVTYYLIYGIGSIRPISVVLQDKSDGVVGEESQLAPPAKAEAREILGLKYEHTAILSAPETLRKLQSYLTE